MVKVMGGGKRQEKKMTGEEEELELKLDTRLSEQK